MSEYLHGYTQDEQLRLAAMQSIINQKQIEMIDLAGVQRILDVGCGLGQFSSLLAETIASQAEETKVLGIEKDQRQLESRLAATGSVVDKNIEFRQGDAYQLPLSDVEIQSFDLVHCRFLLEHVPEPERVIGQFSRALKPNGQVVLLDDDHELLKLNPECPELMNLWTQYWQSYRLLGCDPLVGRRIPELLGKHGIDVTRVDTLFYGASSQEPVFELVVANILKVVLSARDLLLSHSLLSEDDFQEAHRATKAWREKRNATVWYSLPVTFGKLRI